MQKIEQTEQINEGDESMSTTLKCKWNGCGSVRAIVGFTDKGLYVTCAVCDHRMARLGISHAEYKEFSRVYPK